MLSKHLVAVEQFQRENFANARSAFRDVFVTNVNHFIGTCKLAILSVAAVSFSVLSITLFTIDSNLPYGIDCDCVTAGTVGSLRVCDPESGQCSCKARVTERRCSDCSDGFFNLQEDNPFGCMGMP